MSVPSYKQKSTRDSYTVSWKTFYDAVNGVCTSLPKRKQNWLAVPILKRMDKIKIDVFYLSGGKIEGDNVCDIVVGKIDGIYKVLKELQKPFYALWSYKDYTKAKMQRWIDLMMKFANDLRLRYPDFKERDPLTEEIFPIIDLDRAHKADFVDRMMKIHKQVLAYASKSCGRYISATSYQIVELADEALSDVLDGNEAWAKSLEGLEKRRVKFLHALNILKMLNREVTIHCYENGYSDASKKKWMDMVSEEEKLLNGILASEKKKINKLKKEAEQCGEAEQTKSDGE